MTDDSISKAIQSNLRYLTKVLRYNVPSLVRYLQAKNVIGYGECQRIESIRSTEERLAQLFQTFQQRTEVKRKRCHEAFIAFLQLQHQQGVVNMLLGTKEPESKMSRGIAKVIGSDGGILKGALKYCLPTLLNYLQADDQWIISDADSSSIESNPIKEDRLIQLLHMLRYKDNGYDALIQFLLLQNQQGVVDVLLGKEGANAMPYEHTAKAIRSNYTVLRMALDGGVEPAITHCQERCIISGLDRDVIMSQVTQDGKIFQLMDVLPYKDNGFEVLIGFLRYHRLKMVADKLIETRNTLESAVSNSIGSNSHESTDSEEDNDVEQNSQNPSGAYGADRLANSQFAVSPGEKVFPSEVLSAGIDSSTVTMSAEEKLRRQNAVLQSNAEGLCTTLHPDLIVQHLQIKGLIKDPTAQIANANTTDQAKILSLLKLMAPNPLFFDAVINFLSHNGFTLLRDKLIEDLRKFN